MFVLVDKVIIVEPVLFIVYVDLLSKLSIEPLTLTPTRSKSVLSPRKSITLSLMRKSTLESKARILVVKLTPFY